MSSSKRDAPENETPTLIIVRVGAMDWRTGVYWACGPLVTGISETLPSASIIMPT